MVTCNLQGGLGNQLFQISTTIALALENNDEAIFDLKLASSSQKMPIEYKNSIYNKLNFSTINDKLNQYQEPNFHYNKIPYQKNLCLNGYFQSEKYFKKPVQFGALLPIITVIMSLGHVIWMGA